MTIKLNIPLVLTLIFVTLKLCKVITWSWWWVLCPIWIWVVIIFGIFLIACILGGGALTLAGLLSIFSRK